MSFEGTALELRDNGLLVPVEDSAQAILDDGVAQGVVSSELVEFTQAVLPEEGRTPALVLPLYNLLSRHAILSTLETPDEAPETVYGRHYRDSELETKVQKWDLKREPGFGSTAYRYRAVTEGDLTIASSYIVATSQEYLEQIAAWKQRQADRLQELQESSPLGAASTLVESAYGGIDITNPERAVRELSIRSLFSAITLRQHNRTASFNDEGIIHSAFSSLFNHIDSRHHKDYREFTDKVMAAAGMVTVKGAIDPARLNLLAEMIGEDTAGFLQKVWPDLERIVIIKRLGEARIRELVTKFH